APGRTRRTRAARPPRPRWRCSRSRAGSADPMDMPPTRYRVVEQGRRLVVIDTLAGGPVRPVPGAPEMPGERRRRMEAPRPRDRVAPRLRKPEPRGPHANGDGLGFTTARWFDDEGPRTIRIDQEGQGRSEERRVGKEGRGGGRADR